MPVEFHRVEQLNPRQLSILAKLSSYYSDDKVLTVLQPLINQEGNISLRALDWLVTNYAKKHNIVCLSQNNTLFNIHHGYKIALTYFRRRNFDPFRRRQRIQVICPGETTIQMVSTVGQCNFLQWADVNGVLLFARENSKAIEADMNTSTANTKAEKRKSNETGVILKRKELSSAPSAKCLVYQIETNVSFGTLHD